MKDLVELIELSKIKCEIDIKRGEKKYFDFEWLLNEISSEILEVKEELKENNHPYLEDELGDILWGWIILVQKLQREGLVNSHEAIFKRALKKYKERILPLKGDMSDNETWQRVKEEQKKALESEKLKIKS